MPASQVVPLNESGVCRYCADHEKIVFKGEEQLSALFNKLKSKHGKYDCLVNISGGRDSAYTLLSLAKDFKLNVLAVNYANPFTDEQAKRNIERMVDILGVDFFQFHLSGNIHKRILKNNILAWFNNPSPAMVPAICIGCKIIWPEILNIAKKNNIHCIVNGGNPYEYTSFKKELLGVSHKAGLEKTYLQNIFGLCRESFKNLAYLKPEFLPITIKGYLFANQYAPASRLLAGDIERIDLFHYMPWEEETVIRRIKSELDWDSPKDIGSTWRFDCQIGHLKDYMYMKTLGFTEKTDFFSIMVRENILTREAAFKRNALENKLHYDKIERLFTNLGITNIKLA
ncbi:MAG: ATPase [Candidatus Edwardsbacteria bacterium]|nr:ATPase [Candidatus Edwardsbacteria bacterium]